MAKSYLDIDDAPLDDAAVIIHADLDEFRCQCKERGRHHRLRDACATPFACHKMLGRQG